MDSISQSRLCTMCEVDKPLTEYSKNSRYADGHLRRCKACCSKVSAEYWKAHPEERKVHDRKYHSKLKKKVFDYYGYVCNCCGESTEKFLAVDHVNGDGAKHRRGNSWGSTAIYRDIVKQGFPSDYQILCHNCNIGRHLNGGICPHKE